MNIFMIGGTGLLGSEGARELIARGHAVRAIALPPIPEGAILPPEMQITFGNYLTLIDDEIRQFMTGCDGFVFAAGIDERIEGPAPIYDLFQKYNITPLERLLRIAKECGVKHTVICGSYFSYFAKIWPEKELTRWHPYIRSRIDQENMALSFADADSDTNGNFSVAVLELPYIFGTQPGRKPVWVILIEQIRHMKKRTMYPGGGSTMVTVHQVAQAMAGALERNTGGTCYPIGFFNLTWVEFLRIVHRAMGTPDRPIVTIPKWLFRIVCLNILRNQRKASHEGGLNPLHFADIMCSKTFIDRSIGCDALGVTKDDIEAAIIDSIQLSLDVVDGKKETIGMKGE